MFNSYTDASTLSAATINIVQKSHYPPGNQHASHL